MEDVQAALSALAPAQQVDFLLSRLHSAFSAQLRSEREAQRWQATSLEQTQRAIDSVARSQKLQQRLGRLVEEAAGLKEDVRGLHLSVAGMAEVGDVSAAHLNGKEEKQSNGHRPHTARERPLHSTAAPSDSSDLPFIAEFPASLSDFTTLLASTEAQLEVERRERERQQTSSPSPSTQPFPSSFLSLTAAASSPYYHLDRTLTAAGKGLVRSIFLLFTTSASSSSSSMSLQQLQALSERLGRGGAAGGSEDGDDGGDVWWLWQSHASEDEGGGMGLTEEDLQAVYVSEWDLDEDAKRLHIH